MWSALSSRMPFGAVTMPAHTGSAAWHMLQRDSTISSTLAKVGCRWTAIRVLASRGPAADNKPIAIMPRRRHTPDPPWRRASGVPLVEEMADDRAERQHDRDDHPIVARREQQRIVVADHQHHARARSDSCCGPSAPCRPCRASGSGDWPASSAATIFFWFGMMIRNTLATMMVPMIAPIWLKAPRPLRTWVKA